MDKRSEPRIPTDIRFFVHVSECREDPDLVGVSVACEAVDLSTKGLQFKAECAIPVASTVNITIGIGEPFALFLLSGEVRWVREVDDQVYMGILLQDREGMDLGKWTDCFDEIFR